MKSQQITAGREEKLTSNWLAGINSVRNPWGLPENQLKWGVNVAIRGGLAQTRPGFAMRLSLPPGNFQGGVFFKANKQFSASSTSTTNTGVQIKPSTIYNYDGTASTADELDYLVFAVGGSVYFAPFPLTQPKSWNDYKLSGVALSPSADEVVFQICSQVANISASSVTITPQHNLLVVQDGVSAPAYWDGSNKTGAQSLSIPIGKWMAFSGNRLWVANGNLVLASDLGDPTSWLERTTSAGRGDFSFPKKVTGMVSFLGQNSDTRVIVFTSEATYSLASGILDRTQWANTQNFQNTLFPTLGCVAGKSIFFQAGLLWWYSAGGLVSADVTATSYISSLTFYKDSEMARVKRYLSGDLSRICSLSFENYLLASVPYFETLNSASMVMDYSPASELNGSGSPAWCGVWTGIRPIEWTKGMVNNENRAFAFSVDYQATNDGSYNHIWEAFMPQRVDSFLQINPDGTTTTLFNRIYCQIETALLGVGMDLKQIKYGEIEALQIGGTVDLKVSYRGSKGTYSSILNTRLLAVTDDYQYEGTPFQVSLEPLGLLNTQYRRLVTESVQRVATSNSCESPYTYDIDKAFSFLVEWCGEFGVEAIRMYMDPWVEKSVGIPSSDEKQSCVVGETGASELIDILPSPAVAVPNQKPQTVWTGQQTRTYVTNCDPSTNVASVAATAVASFTSYVSLADANQQAGTIALQQAELAAQRYRQQNPC